MRSPAGLENLIDAIAERCRSGLDPDSFRAHVLPRLRRAVPIDALWWTSVDPSTLLFTGAHREEIPAETGPYFVENEFLRDDVNKWTELARGRDGARTLIQATAGRPTESSRYREIFEPLGLEDELRVVMRARGVTWGFMCLHRERGSPFSADEVAFVRRMAPHLAEGIRLGTLMRSLAITDLPDAPGLIVLGADGSLVRANPAAEAWLAEIDQSLAEGELPIEVHAVATRLRRQTPSEADVTQLRVRARTGRWLTLHASWLAGAGATADVAVIVQAATPAQAAPVVMSAYGLTPREQALTALICRGLSTQEIGGQLHITVATVQDHLKSIFDKTGVRSRRELVAAILRQQYLPRAGAGDPIGPSGAFV